MTATATTAAEALQDMHEATGLSIDATVNEMRLAAYAIARATRDKHPSAAWVHFIGSDQGDWLIASEWESHDGEYDDLTIDDLEGAASHLYLPHIGLEGHTEGAVPGLVMTDLRTGVSVLNVEQVLSAGAPPLLTRTLTAS